MVATEGIANSEQVLISNALGVIPISGSWRQGSNIHSSAPVLDEAELAISLV
jgi:hypothetical protein